MTIFYHIHISHMRFQVFIAVKIHITVFWVMTPYSLVGEYRILEEQTASIFRVEVTSTVST
jgi:hypothetical protein